MKDERLSFDDLALFLAVCEAGGLTAAVSRTGTSAPTLSRRMSVLERQTGRRLFLRGNQGYVLTGAGRALRDKASELDALRQRLSDWVRTAPRPPVRITAGTWTSHWLATHLTAFWQQDADWVPSFLSANAVLDIARREADIGLRNRRPLQSWLAGRRLRRITYAEYGRSPDITGYLTLSEGTAGTPSSRWIAAHRPDAIVTTVSDARLAADLAAQGIARVVLPVFAGDCMAELSRLSDPIEELTHDEWLVTHHDARHDPPVRRAIDAITRFIEQGRQ